MSNGEEAAAPPRGGRCVRARQLAERREQGERLDDYGTRLLDSHLAGCSGCTAYVQRLESSRARVGGVEEESRRPEQESGADGRDLVEHEHQERSSVDAMGQDKHRKIVGETYGPTRSRQLAYYGIFVAFVIVLYIGASYAVSQLDKAPAHSPAKAPWSQPKAPQDAIGGFSTDDKGGVTHFQ